MRPILLTALIVVALPLQASALPTSMTPSLTYPQSGTFCGFMTLCSDAADPAPVEEQDEN